MVNPFRRALPWSTRDVQSYSETYELSGDSYYYLKARISKEQFEKYVAKLHLIHWERDRKIKESDINWQNQLHQKLDWWNPGLSEDDTYSKTDTDFTTAKFSEGYLYLRYTCY